LSQTFLAFSVNRNVYHQIHYLDENGREMVRVDYDGVNPPRVMPLEQPQEKQQRYYFTETMQGWQGGIFVSPWI
jgi:methyl-accepting chemotaxis protein